MGVYISYSLFFLYLYISSLDIFVFKNVMNYVFIDIVMVLKSRTTWHFTTYFDVLLTLT